MITGSQKLKEALHKGELCEVPAQDQRRIKYARSLLSQLQDAKHQVQGRIISWSSSPSTYLESRTIQYLLLTLTKDVQNRTIINGQLKCFSFSFLGGGLSVTYNSVIFEQALLLLG